MGTVAVLVALLAGTSFASGCHESESTGKGNHNYCICNSTYCDEAPNVVQTQGKLSYTVVSSSKDGLRFQVSNGTFGNKSAGIFSTKIKIDSTKTYQTIIGFGGSMTDSSGINIKSLSEPVQEKLLRSYFGNGSIEYNMIRVPMGSSDFSPRPYAYAEMENDIFLEKFALADEDIKYKIPYLQKISNLTSQQVKLIASPWSPNPWMKTAGNWTGKGILRREYWQTWANYFVKFFQAYLAKDIKFWALTPQNEPQIAFTPIVMQSMGWDAVDQRDWLTEFLAPIMKKADLDYIKIIIGDGQRHLLPDWVNKILTNAKANKLVSGIAVHWYLDKVLSINRLDKTHSLYPDKFILYTESCSGVLESQKVKLGSWSRAEDYAKSIIDTFNHWVTGWIDWNMALDLKGGPNWLKNNMDAPIIVNASADSFYKQPTYYAIGHFSKFITPGSKRISTTRKGLANIKTIGFLRPDNAKVLILLNQYTLAKTVSVEDPAKGSVKLTLQPKSIHSVIYW